MSVPPKTFAQIYCELFYNLGVLADIFHVEWVFLTRLYVFLHVLDHIHCFFDYSAFSVFSRFEVSNELTNSSPTHQKIRGDNTFLNNTLCVDVTLSVRESYRKNRAAISI